MVYSFNKVIIKYICFSLSFSQKMVLSQMLMVIVYRPFAPPPPPPGRLPNFDRKPREMRGRC